MIRPDAGGEVLGVDASRIRRQVRRSIGLKGSSPR